MVVVCTTGVGVNPVLLLSVVVESTEGDFVVASTVGGWVVASVEGDFIVVDCFT